jgi:LysM repeat protein
MGITEIMKSLKIILLLIMCCWIGHSSAQRYELNKKDTSEVQWIKGSKFYVYKVEKGETIYSITKRFNVTEDVLKANNPDLKDGLKNKMSLLIPAHSNVKSSEAEKKAEVKKPVAKEINVGLMLPVNVWKSMIPDSVFEDSSRNEIDPEALAQIEFYEGAMHALDSLASKNLKIHLSLFDTENDSAKVTALLRDPKVKELNYIIATGNSNVLRKLNQFSMTAKIDLLTPVLNSSELLKNNIHGYALSPSSVTQCYEAGKMCALKFKNVNPIVVQSGTSKEHDRSVAFINGWNDNSEFNCRSIDYSKGEFTFLLASMIKGSNNLLFVPSSNEDFVNNIMTKLNDTIDVYHVTMIGIPTWQYFGSIDPAVMENLHTHLFTASNIDYNDERLISFRRYFRSMYMTEPSESALQGFDAMMLVGKINLSGMQNPQDVIEYGGLYSNYHFKQMNGLNENQFIHMVKYVGYKLVEAK